MIDHIHDQLSTSIPVHGTDLPRVDWLNCQLFLFDFSLDYFFIHGLLFVENQLIGASCTIHPQFLLRLFHACWIKFRGHLIQRRVRGLIPYFLTYQLRRTSLYLLLTQASLLLESLCRVETFHVWYVLSQVICKFQSLCQSELVPYGLLEHRSVSCLDAKE